MAGIPWTEAERDILKKMAEAGKSANDICRVLVCRTRSGVFSQAYDMGLLLSGATPEVDMEAFNQIMGGIWKPQAQE